MFTPGTNPIRQDSISLTSGPREKLLEELGDLLKEGKEGLEWLLWGVMAGARNENTTKMK